MDGTVVDLRSGLWLSLVCQFRDSLMSRHREETWIDPWDISQWKPGDLVCYTEGSGVSHMALYIGNNQIIHALSPKYGTIIHDVDYYEKWDRGT